jgi:hypothetical protein
LLAWNYCRRERTCLAPPPSSKLAPRTAAFLRQVPPKTHLENTAPFPRRCATWAASLQASVSPRPCAAAPGRLRRLRTARRRNS